MGTVYKRIYRLIYKKADVILKSKTIKHLNNTRKEITFTAIVCLMLAISVLLAIFVVFNNAEEEGFNELHLETKNIKDSIELQIVSDSENLNTIANLASKLYDDGEDLSVLVKSFKPIGLIREVQILFPDESLLSKSGSHDISGWTDFDVEAEKRYLVSGRVSDWLDQSSQIVRIQTPIVSDNKTVAVLYGVIDLETFKDKYIALAEEQQAQLYIIVRKTGNFIIDTYHKGLGNVTSLKSRVYNDGFSYEKLRDDIYYGEDGFVSLISEATGKNAYLHYAPLSVGGWQIMLLKPEKIVFAHARNIARIMLILFGFVMSIIIVYITVMFRTETKQTRLNQTASIIRKKLLEVNRNYMSISFALKDTCEFASSRSAFFVDTDGEDFNYISPECDSKLLSGIERKYFVAEIMSLASTIVDKNPDSTVNISEISLNKKLYEHMPMLYDFLKFHQIKNVLFSCITNKSGNISVLGVINTKNRFTVKSLLQEVSICFTIAIHNKKHVEKTEYVATTDSLTGLSNRVAFKRDMAQFDEKMPKDFSCIYVDVNELHAINNKYGHDAGDGMLIYVANSLTEVFTESKIYRIGGDEFLVFSEDILKEKLGNLVETLTQKIESMNYHVSIGLEFRQKNTDTESVVKEAERKMYEAKALYYQRKEHYVSNDIDDKKMEHLLTGIPEFDAVLDIIGKHYMGIYTMSISTDIAHPVLIPEYLKQSADENHNCFSKLFKTYVSDMVAPDFQRQMLNFLKYDVLQRQLLENINPTMIYEKSNGGKYRLTVYSYSKDCDKIVWVFEQMN